MLAQILPPCVIFAGSVGRICFLIWAMDSGGGCVSITAWFTAGTSQPRTTLLTLIACRSPVADKHL